MSCDVYVSHVPADREWAEWVARVLTGAGLRVSLPAGRDHDTAPDRDGIAAAVCTVAVASPDYLVSRRGDAEWQLALNRRPDPRLVVLRLARAPWPSALDAASVVDGTGVDREAAREQLLHAVTRSLAGGRRTARDGGGRTPGRSITMRGGGRWWIGLIAVVLLLAVLVAADLVVRSRGGPAVVDGPRYVLGVVAHAETTMCLEAGEDGLRDGVQIVQEECQASPYRVPQQQLIARRGPDPTTYRLEFAFSGRCLGITGDRAVQTPCDRAPGWIMRTAGAAGAALPLPSHPDEQQWRAFRIETSGDAPLCVAAPDHDRKDLVTVVACAPDERDGRWADQVWCTLENPDLPAAIGA